MRGRERDVEINRVRGRRRERWREEGEMERGVRGRVRER